ncbi:MAG TPA: chemotaxis protein CheW [Thiohalobacter sp.]|nr:chemotaxis protein CheW [Thiohalobacter sp.]
MTQTPDNKDPVHILFDLERRLRHAARPLPSEVELREDWVGIGFRLGGHRFVSPLGEVTEILTPTDYSKVPGAKSWVQGIANVRGNLLPIMDLQGFLHGHRAATTRRSRVLVINHAGVHSGLVVDEVLGLRHFMPEDQTPEPPTDDAAIRPYLDGGFRIGDEHWGVFSMRRLAETPQFLQAAL